VASAALLPSFQLSASVFRVLPHWLPVFHHSHLFAIQPYLRRPLFLPEARNAPLPILHLTQNYPNFRASMHIQLSKSEMGSEMPVAPKRNNRQHQPLTTLLRNIIREYPAGGGVLRELCQNADDAGATTIEFVLDRKQYPADWLLHSDLAEHQGASLLAYNDRTFSEVDFGSLSSIGDSAKAGDLTSAGKFGRGFNSVSTTCASFGAR
jgi:hypothetical protein